MKHGLAGSQRAAQPLVRQQGATNGIWAARGYLTEPAWRIGRVAPGLSLDIGAASCPVRPSHRAAPTPSMAGAAGSSGQALPSDTNGLLV